MIQQLKVISLWQPWASLMALGYKGIETRGWSTSYRGELGIHAAKKRDEGGRWLWEDEQEDGAIERHLGSFDKLPFGQLVALVDLVDVVPTRWLLESHEDKASYLRVEFFGDSKPEERYGNYSPGRFAWITRNRRSVRPVPVRGEQGLFTVDRSIIEAHL